MNEYLLLFRRDYQTKELQPTPDQLQENLKQWGEWFGKLKAKDKIVVIPPRFDGAGKVLNSNKTIANGPYLEPKNRLAVLSSSKPIRTSKLPISPSTVRCCNWEGILKYARHCDLSKPRQHPHNISLKTLQ